MEDIIVYGAGSHGKTVLDIIEDQGLYRVVGVLDDNENSPSTVLGYPVIVNREEKENMIRHAYGGVVGIADGRIRSRIVSKLEDISPNFRFVNVIHPSSCISNHAKIRQGAVVMPGVRLGVDSAIGNHCIVCSKALISHDNILGDYVFIGPSVCCSGSVTIGPYSYVLSGSTIINNTVIGRNTVIGSASNVVSDMPSDVVAYGNPARIVRSMEPGSHSLFRKRVSAQGFEGQVGEV